MLVVIYECRQEGVLCGDIGVRKVVKYKLIHVVEWKQKGRMQAGPRDGSGSDAIGGPTKDEFTGVDGTSKE